MSSDANIVSEYINITDKYKKIYGNKTLLLMMVGAFYEIYALKDKNDNIRGSNIVEACSICELNISDGKKQMMGNEYLLMAGFRDYSIEKYIPKLLDYEYTVVVYNQTKTPTKIIRELDCIYSPGTYISPEEKINNITNNIMCIWMETIKTRNHEKVIYGLSVINIFTGKSNIFEYESDSVATIMNPTVFDELERAVSVFSPSEVIFISPFDETTVRTICQYSSLQCNIHSINIDESNDKVNNCTKQTYISYILDTFFGDETYSKCIEFSNFIFATQSLCYLLDFVKEHNASLVKHISFPEFSNVSNRTILANHTLQQLNIIDNRQGHGHLSCVLSFTNKCCTPSGKRMFKYNLTNPTFDETWLSNEYDMISHMLSQYDNVEIIRKRLLGTADVEKLLRQLITRKFTPIFLYKIYNTINVIIHVINLLSNNQELHDYLSNNNDILSSSQEFIDFIHNNLDIEACQKSLSSQTFEINIIKPGMSEELDQLLENQKNNETIFEEIIKKLNDIMKKEHGNNREQEFIKKHELTTGTTLQMTKRRSTLFKEIIRKNGDIVINVLYDRFSLNEIKMVSASGNSDEINFPLLTKVLKNKISLQESINKKIAELFQEILIEVEQEWLKKLQDVCSYISKVDVLTNKTYLAKKYNYCKPEIKESSQSFVDTKGLKHCLIEHIQTNEIYVSNDLHIGCNEQNGILLYGTNAVGKTSLIRSLGIAVILAQCGMFVPCSQFVYKPYTAIFSRILGNDNLFKGLSTFAVEISELRVILKMANNSSLILGDEVCSGTETESALSIFVSALMDIHSKNSSFIFATHFHEITNYDEIKSLTNMVLYHMHVVFDKEQGCLIYDRKLKLGSGTRMYGLEVCKSLYLDNDFLQQAYEIRNKYFPNQEGELSHKKSTYNAKKIRGKCEMCKVQLSTEVHHIEHQKNADENGFIESFHKNHPANLLSLCEECHLKIHSDNKKMKKKKTTKGTQLIECQE